jgi:hypothetical protein
LLRDEATRKPSLSQGISVVVDRYPTESPQQSRLESFSFNSLQALENRRQASKKRLQEALLKKSNTPVKQAYYCVDAKDIQPKTLSFDDCADTQAKSPKKPLKRRQSGGVEMSCCEACLEGYFL